MRWLRAAVAAAVCVFPAKSEPQHPASLAATSVAANGIVLAKTPPLVQTVQIEGLRRISPDAVRAQIHTCAGSPLNIDRLNEDVRTLARLNWFRDISIESEDLPLAGNSLGIRIIFKFVEQPWVTEITYAGSRTFSKQQIEKILSENKLAPRTGQPENAFVLESAARAIRSSLVQTGHPDAKVAIERESSGNATERVRFVIDDGPRVTLGRFVFDGDLGLSSKLLARQTRELKPNSLLAGLREKDVFAPDKFEADLARLLAYYQDHGYPEAHIGSAIVSRYEEKSWRWFPWPHSTIRTREQVAIPVQAGPLYRTQFLSTDDALISAASQHRKIPQALVSPPSGAPYSAERIEELRRAWFAVLTPKPRKSVSEEFHGVDVTRAFDPDTQTVRVRFTLSSEPPFVVRRLELQGLHRFSDRFVRRRILLQEGKPLDERALETGLTRLVRTGYFRPIKKEDIHVETEPSTHTASVKIRLQEIGQQRASLVGGQSSYGNTLGIIYSVFDLLNREELLSTQIEGGPESLQAMLGIAKEGFLGSRGSLAISLFDNFLKPHLVSSVKGPFFTSESIGVSAGYTYAVSTRDAIGVNYGISRSITDYSLALPAGLTGLTSADLRSEIYSRSVTTAWTHDSGSQRISFSDSVSGGWLGGNENMLRTTAEYGRIVADPISNKQNAWAFRTTFKAAGSYSGDMPLYARMFSGEEIVRGLREGELGPYAVTASTNSSGATVYTAAPAGANIVAAQTVEYRIPLRNGVQAVPFFDIGSGILLPNWLGSARPALIASTNQLLHGSTGIELRWTIPGLGVPVRTYYAVNLLRLNKYIPLPDGSVYHAHNRFSAFGWALGALF